MNPIQFVFSLHNHQPVGNFDHVFEEAYRQAYLPFLELLECFPDFRASLHHTGPLLQWITKNKVDYIDRLGVLVDQNQVELLGGGFYEPIISILPERDRIGQINMMSNWLEKVFGKRPRGMWLAERVWAPSLAKTLPQAGIEFTILDDFHLQSVGISQDLLSGYFLTEEEGYNLAIFPINETLRSKIPYAETTDIIDFFKNLSRQQMPNALAVMADDGEKFGVWPDSFWYCYREGWMYRFAEQVSNNKDWLKMKNFAEVLDSTAPMERVYLPSGSYPEMMRWSMPAKSGIELNRFANEIAQQPDGDKKAPFIRAGYWKSFFNKYAESNHLYKKMLRISSKLENLAPENKAGKPYALALDALWRSQCNCAYWHGLFGGLYLTNLRTALYKNLIIAETYADQLAHQGATNWLLHEAVDFDSDGGKELFVETAQQNVVIQPHAGGIILEHDLKKIAFNLHDTLMRRFESYHQDLIDQAGATKAKEENLQDYLVQDVYRRGSLHDHFFDQSTTPADVRTMKYTEKGDFAYSPYTCSWKAVRGKSHVELERMGTVHSNSGDHSVRIEKKVVLSSSDLKNQLFYRVSNLSPQKLETRFGIEFNINLLAGNALDRFHEIQTDESIQDRSMLSEGVVADVQEFSLVDQYMGLKVHWQLDQPCTHWRFPIETVSNSEAGLERIYQATVIMLLFNLALLPGESFDLSINYTQEVTT
ncbi:MAG: alpha-amylase/4-alpha-glucanotransferase domain-containing protein [Sumerlaeia bacterium]